MKIVRFAFDLLRVFVAILLGISFGASFGGGMAALGDKVPALAWVVLVILIISGCVTGYLWMRGAK